MKPIKIQWSLRSPRYFYADCEGWLKRRFTVRVNIAWAWESACQDAARFHKNQFEQFLDEILDTLLHEFAHIYGPCNLKTIRGERMARAFAMYGRWTRR